MSTLKYSKQREAIKLFLINRYDHPTADTIYAGMRETFPHISLGTVYRNLALLSDRGEILKISTDEGPDRFDGNTAPHSHFICKNCHQVLDLEMENIDYIKDAASQNFDGIIEGYIAHFYGLCADCKQPLQ